MGDGNAIPIKLTYTHVFIYFSLRLDDMINELESTYYGSTQKQSINCRRRGESVSLILLKNGSED